MKIDVSPISYWHVAFTILCFYYCFLACILPNNRCHRIISNNQLDFVGEFRVTCSTVSFGTIDFISLSDCRAVRN